MRARVVYVADRPKVRVYHFDSACPALRRVGYRTVRLRDDGRVALGAREAVRLSPCARCVVTQDDA